MTCSESLPHTQFLLRAVQLEHSAEASEVAELSSQLRSVLPKTCYITHSEFFKLTFGITYRENANRWTNPSDP